MSLSGEKNTKNTYENKLTLLKDLLFLLLLTILALACRQSAQIISSFDIFAQRGLFLWWGMCTGDGISPVGKWMTKIVRMILEWGLVSWDGIAITSHHGLSSAAGKEKRHTVWYFDKRSLAVRSKMGKLITSVSWFPGSSPPQRWLSPSTRLDC